MTPTKNEILEKARELWHMDRVKQGDPSFDLEPEALELEESGYVSAAKSQLMMSFEKRNGLEQSENFDLADFESVFDFESLLRSGTVIFGGSGCGKSTLAKSIVRKLDEKRIVSYIIDPSKSWLDQPFDKYEIAIKETLDWKCRNSVFDVSLLSINEKILFTNALAKALLEGHITGRIGHTEILVMEEAETYLSNNSLRSRKLENVLTLISTGRNFGLRFIAISQVPSMIDKLPVKLCEQRFFKRLSEPNDQRYCKQLLNKEWVEQLKGLEVGFFISENKGKIQRFKLEIPERTQAKGLNFAYTFNPFLSTETFI